MEAGYLVSISAISIGLLLLFNSVGIRRIVNEYRTKGFQVTPAIDRTLQEMSSSGD